MRGTRRRKSQKNARSGFLGLLRAEQDVGDIRNALLGLLCAEQNVGNLKNADFQEFWDSDAQNKTLEISNTCTFRKSGTLVTLHQAGLLQSTMSAVCMSVRLLAQASARCARLERGYGRAIHFTFPLPLFRFSLLLSMPVSSSSPVCWSMVAIPCQWTVNSEGFHTDRSCIPQ